MPGTRSEDSTPRIRPSISPINSPMPPTEYSIAERPAREDSPDRRYYNDRAASRSRSRSRSPKESRSRRKSTDYRERSTSAPAWIAPERPKTLDYQPTLVLKGHKKAISAVKFSPDGKRIASCSADGTIKIWDAFTGEHEHTLEGHMAGISAIAWSPDSTTIASGSDDKSIRLWDAIKVTWTSSHPSSIAKQHNRAKHTQTHSSATTTTFSLYNSLPRETCWLAVLTTRPFSYGMCARHGSCAPSQLIRTRLVV